MIEEIEWTCPDCKYKQSTMIFSTKGSTLRCKKCLGTFTAYYEGPFIVRLIAGLTREEVIDDGQSNEGFEG